ncbi:transposase, partial [Xenorhabdus bovienii]|uniref:transposase n=1 Tax=Xenorhabdus bovienii TaxID=40576 RepID=UPI003DA4F770
ILHLIFNWLSGLSDTEWLFIDGSIVRAHQHSAGAASEEDEAIGQSRGGRSTKIHLAVDSYGLPVHFELSGGQVNDIVHAESLVSQL